MENPQADAAQESVNQSDSDQNASKDIKSTDNQNKSAFAGVLSGFNGLDMARQLGLLAGFAASIAIGFAIVLWSQEEDYRPLLSSIGEYDSPAVVEILERNGIGYKVDPKSGALLVLSNQIYQARMKIAASDVARTNTVGYELLDQEQGLGTSQFMESARYRRSVEGELARTISSLQSVKGARVHLAIPKQSVFVRDYRKPSASVFLHLQSGASLDSSQANAIVNLVATSIPELDPKNVTIVDQRGRLLSQMEAKESDKQIQRQFEYSRKLERVLTERVRSILEPVLGPGRYQAAVSAEVDFTETEQTEELYNPDLPALRSEQVLNEQRVGDMNQAGIPGALSNQPPTKVSSPEQALDKDGNPIQQQLNSRKQATRNFELDRTVSYSKNQLGRVDRLTVAVVVDDIIIRDPNTGDVVRRAWDENELRRVEILVRDAVGFSALRGDSVNVVNSPFADGGEGAIEKLPFYQEPWFWEIAKQVLAGLFVLILIFGVLRPVLRSLATAKDANDGADASDEMLTPLDDLGEDHVTLSASDDPLLAGPNEAYERQLNAIRAMIAEDPGRVAQVVRQWVVSDE
ncbi:flagellar M-ring protein FliF [Oceanospirillum multiglobuliferum]|uniref:Flagellar M-ring protein n=1 Tax=Oceanospirillum multiglobuliferum TaxID=64969 RepID=A0A1T4L3R0_9GAMM|nr:flagellar basal-body MS-ring/collar protein FliF [Oceanospirillum multiglobuliferum]OPX56812.1 flagellar M-ring protein FliF [Oceanospirillum multiglobuliferum]SJZ49372.1 flagellar M-ring protein FliF [Oceanospirillum multiglobuliferum]